ncbi:hypothetical protein JTE90_007830 [Oedothorax gibbosus]|uniref:Gustatory receptor n=1 Tax=Oedothorax gibbosus TaxID=931172 RepID=A0AAV6VKK6_9ARAC|nr:hypothetical protein JTE90_007830 [Oedothorax gibbosus]
MFCYTLIRRYLEIVCLYLTRWIILSSLFFFILSSLSLLWLYLKRRSSTKKIHKYSGSNSNRLMWATTFLTLSLVTILAFLLPFLADLVTGKLINKELDILFGEKDKRFGNSVLFKTVFKNNVRSCSTVYDMYQFHCLQKILFNFQLSDISYNEPTSASEIFCCQIQLTLVYLITFIAYCMLYSKLVLICYVIVRAIWRIFKPLSKIDKNKQLMESSRIPFPKLATTHQLEICTQKFVEPGIKHPWKELSFSDFTSTTSLKEKTYLNKTTSTKNSPQRKDYNKKKFKSCGVQTSSSYHGILKPDDDIENFTVSTTPLRNENDYKYKNASNLIEDRSYNREHPVPKSQNYFTKNSLSLNDSIFPRTQNLYSGNGQITTSTTLKNASTQVCFEDSDDSSYESDEFSF